MPTPKNEIRTQLDDQASSNARVESPMRLKEIAKRLAWQQKQLETQQKSTESSLEKIEAYLAIADDVTTALEELSAKLFQQLVGTLEEKISMALQDILEQPIEFRAVPKTMRKATVLEFSIERDGNPEDARRAQGGSVHNILSVGLRLFALASLSQEHSGFLVLDEQDCWLRPELVPKLVKIVHETGTELGFQVLMISHHDTKLFDRHADKIYRLEPHAKTVRAIVTQPEPDAH